MKKRTITGLAVLIAANGAIRCGGVAVKIRKLLQGVNFRNISPKMTSRRVMKRKQKGFKSNAV